MVSEPATRSVRASRGDRRRADILDAAIEQFSARGPARTSMAHIAEAAGVSRPALYQYFRDKDEIFASAFVGLFEDLVERSLAALEGPGTLTQRLDGFLQRYEGDLWERMSASPHVDEIVSAKNAEVAAATAALVAQRDDALRAQVRLAAPGRSAEAESRRDSWVQLLRLAPKGFTTDQPSIPEMRERLSALASVVAADIEAGRR